MNWFKSYLKESRLYLGIASVHHITHHTVLLGTTATFGSTRFT